MIALGPEGSREDAEAPPSQGFRPDIDGLRAIAIGLVVAYHADVPGLDGGFIGVDVFFVISGFLITRNLVAESAGSGGVSLVDFWARRIRRLVPALALLVVAVLVAVVLLRPALVWDEAARQGRAAALYVSNFTFATESTDYFAADVRSSPFLHTWSLAVEEQFYLVWPLLVGAVSMVAVRRRLLLPPLLTVVFGATFAASFALNLVQTGSGSVWAFYGLPARAWEFAAAGLLALAPPLLARSTTAARSAAALGGLAILAYGALVFDELDPYPGLRALVPVVGTLLLVASSDGSPSSGFPPLSALLCWRPVQWGGRVSYSWYLWHWPFIVLAVEVVEDDAPTVKVAAAAAALVVATGAHHLVENPVRFSSAIAGSRRRTYVMGAVVTAVTVLATFGVGAFADREVAGDEVLVSLDEVAASARVYVCAEVTTTDAGDEYCLDGDPDGATSVLLLGDSHARHWTPAFIEAARAEGIRLYVRWRGRCPSVDVLIAGKGSREPDPECLEFREGTRRVVEELDPDAVVLSNGNSYGPVILSGPGGSTPEEKALAWGRAHQDQLEELRAGDRRVGSVVDTPRLPFQPTECISEKGSPEACTVTRDEALGVKAGLRDAEAAAVEAVGGVTVLDVNDRLCPAATCPLVLDGTYVYADSDHLYREYAELLAPEVAWFLRELMG